MPGRRERSAAMFHIKNLGILNLHPMLEGIVSTLYKKFGLDVITSAFRPGDPKCHGTSPELRGIDIRCRDMLIANHIAEFVNARWQYDPKRPTMKCAKPHKQHLHLQVYPSTVKHRGGW